jgi:hypothetical protein
MSMSVCTLHSALCSRLSHCPLDDEAGCAPAAWAPRRRRSAPAGRTRWQPTYSKTTCPVLANTNELVYGPPKKQHVCLLQNLPEPVAEESLEVEDELLLLVGGVAALDARAEVVAPPQPPALGSCCTASALRAESRSPLYKKRSKL